MLYLLKEASSSKSHSFLKLFSFNLIIAVSPFLIVSCDENKAYRNKDPKQSQHVDGPPRSKRRNTNKPKNITDDSLSVAQKMDPVSKQFLNDLGGFFESYAQDFKNLRTDFQNALALSSEKYSKKETDLIGAILKNEEVFYQQLKELLKPIFTTIQQGISTDHQFYRLLIIFSSIIQTLRMMFKIYDNLGSNHESTSKLLEHNEAYAKTAESIKILKDKIKKDLEKIKKDTPFSKDEISKISDSRIGVPYSVSLANEAVEHITGTISDRYFEQYSDEQAVKICKSYLSFIRFINTWAHTSKDPLLTKRHKETIQKLFIKAQKEAREKLGI